MYLAATVLICQVQCNILPSGTSGSVIFFLGHAAVGWLPLSAGSCETTSGYAMLLLYDVWMFFVLSFIPNLPILRNDFLCK